VLLIDIYSDLTRV